jgi:hypothetical protein
VKRFAIHPGEVRSQSDGQRHFISGGQLIRLYELNPADCFIVRYVSGEIVDPELLPLYPLPDGRYKDHLLQIKVSHFEVYRKARKLFVFHSEGGGPIRQLRGANIERQRKIIARWERQWPDFRAAYDRMDKR